MSSTLEVEVDIQYHEAQIEEEYKESKNPRDQDGSHDQDAGDQDGG
jgi:hypothetical protein